MQVFKNLLIQFLIIYLEKIFSNTNQVFNTSLVPYQHNPKTEMKIGNKLEMKPYKIFVKY